MAFIIPLHFGNQFANMNTIFWIKHWLKSISFGYIFFPLAKVLATIINSEPGLALIWHAPCMGKSIRKKRVYRAYPGSEFVVANTLAKWRKLEPNKIDFSKKVVSTNSLPACSDFCHLLITFANSLEPDQARHNVAPDLDPNCLTP